VNHRFFIFLFYSLFASYITANNFHDSFVLPCKPLLTFYDNEPIHINAKKYQQIIDKWQQKLELTWKNLLQELNKKIKISSSQIDELLTSEAFTHTYTMIRKKEVYQTKDMCTYEEDADPIIINFIKHFLYKHCSPKNLKIILTPHMPDIVSVCGSNSDTHYVFCNSILYSTENIKHCYEALTGNNGLFNINILEASDIQFIEISNLLLVGITKVASHIEHQNNIFSFLISYLLYNKHISEEEGMPIVKRYMQYTEIRSILEAIFQSKNPLEAAFYCAKSHNPSTREYKILQELTRDIATCYHPQSLAKFKKITQDLKSLYQDFC